jgi:predicted RNA-binding Zn ribbon-like protein
MARHDVPSPTSWIGGMGEEPLFASHDPGPEGVLLPIAQSAFALLSGQDLERLHRCANDRCMLLFYDQERDPPLV